MLQLCPMEVLRWLKITDFIIIQARWGQRIGRLLSQQDGLPYSQVPRAGGTVSSWLAVDRPSSCVLTWETARETESQRHRHRVGGTLVCFPLPARSLIPTMRAAPSWLNHLPKVPPPNTVVYWELGLQHVIWGLGGGSIFSPQHPTRRECPLYSAK